MIQKLKKIYMLKKLIKDLAKSQYNTLCKGNKNYSKEALIAQYPFLLNEIEKAQKELRVLTNSNKPIFK